MDENTTVTPSPETIITFEPKPSVPPIPSSPTKSPSFLSRLYTLKKGIVLTVFCLVSLVVFGYHVLPGLVIAWLFVCGDVVCRTDGIISLLILWLSSFLMLLAPGIFLYALLYKRWKLPLFLLSLLVCIFLLTFFVQLFMAPGSIVSSFMAGIQHEGLGLTLLSGMYGFSIMFVIYTLSFFGAYKKRDQGVRVVSGKSELLLRGELVLFIMVLCITTFMPSVVQHVESYVSIKKSPIPLGTVYYQLQSVGLQKDVPYIMALDAHGKKQQIAIPTECTHTLVSWSKQKLFCYGDTRGYLIDPTTHTTKQVTMGQRFITSDHAWSADGNYIVVTTNYIVSSSQLQMLNLGTMQFETVTPTVFDGYIGRAVFSPDGTHIAFSVAKNQVNSKEEIMLYSFLTKRVTSLLENPVCPGDSDCSIRGMQFSHDSSTLYYATESFTTSTTKPYVDTLVLVHLSDLQQQKVVKANRDSILDSFSFSSYDGAQSLLYSTSPYGTNVHKLSIATNTETVLKLHDNVSLGSEPLLTPDGQWVLYTQQENATRVTYMEKLDTTKRYAIFTGNEKVIAVRNNTLGE